MSVYPLFLVLGSDGTIGAYADKTLMKINLAENFQAGHPARVVYELQQTINVSYAPAPDFAIYTVPLENLCPRHKVEALPKPTAEVCIQCSAEQKAKGQGA